MAQAPEVPAVRTSGAITLDGVINEAEWGAPSGTGMVDRDDRRPSENPVTFWLRYDEKAIYFAARVTQDPSQVRNETTRQNAGFRNDDIVTLALDAQGLGTGFDDFRVNANTGRTVELEGGRATKTEWLGQFTSNGRKIETGWEVEVRIPWSLVTRRQPGTRNLKFQVSHRNALLQRTSSFYVNPNNGRDVPIWTGVEVPDVRETTTLKLLPYATSALGEDEVFGINTGLDFKSDLPSGQTVVGTVNPDFRNIENSILSNDFSYFERLAGENRPFFAEGARYLDSGGLFASQRISDIDFGAKFYGQMTPRLGLGVMNLTDFGNQNTTVVSAQGSGARRLSYEAAFVEHQRPGRNNSAQRLGLSQGFGTFSVGLGARFTDDQERGAGYAMNAGVYHNSTNFFAGLEFEEVSADFFPRVGFARERDFRNYSIQANYSREFRTGPIKDAYTYASFNRATRVNGERYRGNTYVAAGVGFRNQIDLDLSYSSGYFEEFNDHRFGIGLEYPDNDPVRNIEVNYSEGRIGGREFTRWSVGKQFRPLSNLFGSLSYDQFDRGSVSQQLLGRVTYELNDYESVSLRLVYDDDDFNAFMTYRLSGKVGPEYFLVVGDPRSESWRSRLAFKVTVPLELRF